MIAKLLSFAWFGFGNLKRLWDEEINEKDFWEKPLNNHICWDSEHGIHFLLPPDRLRQYYKQEMVEKLFLEQDKENHQHRWGLWREGVGEQIKCYYNQVKKSKEEFDWDKANEYFWRFIGLIQYNKLLILFSQRNYINSEFSDYNQMEDIEDTNVPWDWDHIYPNSWVYNMKYCEQIIRDWNGTTGNFRAISLEQNRSENNTESPQSRLTDEHNRNISFVYENDWQYWQKIDGRIWDKEKALYHFRAITARMINIYEKFWNDLKINDLIQL
jgi:hypothetical protein